MLLNHCRLYAPLSGGFAGEDCCVELDGGKITAVGPARPDTAEAFDCGGQTLLPGLIEMACALAIPWSGYPSRSGRDARCPADSRTMTRASVRAVWSAIRDRLAA